MRVDRVSADGVPLEGEAMFEAFGDCEQHTLGFANDLGADPVSRQQYDLSVHPCSSSSRGVMRPRLARSIGRVSQAGGRFTSGGTTDTTAGLPARCAPFHFASDASHADETVDH